jgi:hypothetical protein
MGSASRHENERSSGSFEKLLIRAKAEVALEDVPHLVFALMNMQWWALAWRNDILDKGERTACVLRARFDDRWAPDGTPDRLAFIR